MASQYWALRNGWEWVLTPKIASWWDFSANRSPREGGREDVLVTSFADLQTLPTARHWRVPHEAMALGRNKVEAQAALEMLASVAGSAHATYRQAHDTEHDVRASLQRHVDAGLSYQESFISKLRDHPAHRVMEWFSSVWVSRTYVGTLAASLLDREGDLEEMVRKAATDATQQLVTSHEFVGGSTNGYHNVAQHDMRLGLIEFRLSLNAYARMFDRAAEARTEVATWAAYYALPWPVKAAT